MEQEIGMHRIFSIFKYLEEEVKKIVRGFLEKNLDFTILDNNIGGIMLLRPWQTSNKNQSDIWSLPEVEL